jgi:hypothetical protein
LQITIITYIMNIMTSRVHSAAVVLEPNGVHFHTVEKAMKQVTASLTTSASSLASVYAVMVFKEEKARRPNVLAATRNFLVAYKQGLEALSEVKQLVLTHPDMDHIHSLKMKELGDVRLYWGKATAAEIRRKIPGSPGIYILISGDIDQGFWKELDLPLVPKAFENIPLLLQVPHHGSWKPAENPGTTPQKHEILIEDKMPNRETLEWRKRFMEENSCLTSDQIAEEATSQATNRAAIASRWIKEKKIFSVRFEGAQWFPTFQFQDGRPIAAIREVIEIFPEQASSWELAYFFVTPNMNISGQKPVELVKKDPTRLVSLAKAFVHPADVF